MSLELYFYDGYYIPIALSNPLSGRRYPERGEVLALIDTGFDGFLVIPQEIFGLLDIIPSREATIIGVCCEVKSEVGPIRLIIDPLNLIVDGECATYRGAREIILGIEALSKLKLMLDGCRHKGTADRCMSVPEAVKVFP